MSDEPTTPAKGVDVPERITRAIVAAKERFHAENPDRPNGFTIRRAIEAARAQWRLERPGRVNGRDVLFDAIVNACGGDLASLTPSYSAQVAKAKKEICAASPDVTPDEILRRAARYRGAYREAACTPLALTKHWPEFGLPGKKGTAIDYYKEPEGWREAVRRNGIVGCSEGAVAELCARPWADVRALWGEAIHKALSNGR